MVRTYQRGASLLTHQAMREGRSGKSCSLPCASAARMRWAMSFGADSPPVVIRGVAATAPEAPNPAAPMPVAMKDGQISVTCTPRSCTSVRRVSKKPCRACLLAQ